MRGRALIVLTAVAILLAGLAALSALRGTRTARSTTTVELAAARGRVLPVDVELPDAAHTKARVFVVRPAGRPVMALLGISTHLGCRLLFRGDPAFGRGFPSLDGIAFEDPCGGSSFALDGRCVGGPCPRDLDRYAVKLVDGTATFDLHQLQRGPLRGTV
ncbi:MAG: Rieske [2Fe-2S] domain [Actinomycetota bacterium]|nr:Rieske [2Fe-2S] domain [Actinomycetota bacterium]